MPAPESRRHEDKSIEAIYSLEEIAHWKKFINMFMPQWRIKIEVFKIVEAMKKLSKYPKDPSALTMILCNRRWSKICQCLIIYEDNTGGAQANTKNQNI